VEYYWEAVASCVIHQANLHEKLLLWGRGGLEGSPLTIQSGKETKNDKDDTM
jgi:hypothetical protein